MNQDDIDLVFLSVENNHNQDHSTVKNKKRNNKPKEFIETNENNLIAHNILNYDENNLEDFESKEKIKFIGKDNGITWPKNSSIVCWWCCHSFIGSPTPIPISYDQVKNLFKVYGHFCSFNCAKSYILKIKNFERNIYLLSFLQYKITGKIETIKEAPPRETLKIFGGFLDIEKFRANSSVFSLVNPPFLPFNSRIQEEVIEQKINLVPKNTYLSFSEKSEKTVKKLSNLGIKTIKKK